MNRGDLAACPSAFKGVGPRLTDRQRNGGAEDGIGIVTDYMVKRNGPRSQGRGAPCRATPRRTSPPSTRSSLRDRLVIDSLTCFADYSSWPYWAMQARYA